MSRAWSERIREALDDNLVPWFAVDGALAEGVMRRCLLCGRTSHIVPEPKGAIVSHGSDCPVVALRLALAALATRPEPSIDVRETLLAIPDGVQPKPGLSSVAGWNRYDTDDEHVLHLWAHPMDSPSTSWDIRVPKTGAGLTAEDER